MHYNEDDRAQRLLNVFPEVNGQINISYVNSTNHVVAWHKHEIQTDYWICLKGSFKVGLAYPIDMPQEAGDMYDVKWEYLSDKNFKVISIPPGIYHGYKALEPNSILMYYLTEKYDVTDEYRAPVGFFGEVWETKNK
jgi:dTDP-4-dehydrorhamnose 3,5-epimerase-like enzyme